MRTIAVRLGLRYSHCISTVIVPLLFFLLIETGIRMNRYALPGNPRFFELGDIWDICPRGVYGPIIHGDLEPSLFPEEYLWSERVRHWGLPLRDRFLCSGFFVPAVNRSKGGIDPLVYWLFLAEKRFHLTITPCSDSYCPILGYIKQVTVALWGTVNPPWSTSFAVDLDPVTTDDTGLAINIKNFSDNRTTYDFVEAEIISDSYSTPLPVEHPYIRTYIYFTYLVPAYMGLFSAPSRPSADMAHSLLLAYQAHLDPLTSYMWETKPLLWPRTVARVMARRQLLPTLIAPVMYDPRRWVAVFMMQMESYCTICELRAESDFIAAYCDRFQWLVAEMFNKNVGTMLQRLKRCSDWDTKGEMSALLVAMWTPTNFRSDGNITKGDLETLAFLFFLSSSEAQRWLDWVTPFLSSDLLSSAGVARSDFPALLEGVYSWFQKEVGPVVDANTDRQTRLWEDAVDVFFQQSVPPAFAETDVPVDHMPLLFFQMMVSSLYSRIIDNWFYSESSRFAMQKLEPDDDFSNREPLPVPAGPATSTPSPSDPPDPPTDINTDMGVSITVLTDPTDFVLPAISTESSDRALLRNSSASLLGVNVLYIVPLTLAITIATASRIIFCACPDCDLLRSPSFAFTRDTLAVAHWVSFVEDISVDVVDCFLMSVVFGHIVTGVDARGGTVSADVLNFFECQLTLSTFLRLVCPNRELHRLFLVTFICIVVSCSLDYYITRHRDTTYLLTCLSAIPTFKAVVYWRVRVLNYDVTSRPTSTSFGSMTLVTYLSAFLWCLLLFIKDYGKDLHQKHFLSHKAGGGDPFAAVQFDNVSTPPQDKHHQSAPLFQMHLKIFRGTEVNLLGGVTSGTNIVERVVGGLSPVSTGRVWWNGNQLGPAFAEVGGRQIVQGLLSSKRKVGTQLKFVLSMRRADLSPHQVDVHTRVMLTLFMLEHVADTEVASLAKRDLCLFDIALSVTGGPAVVFLPPCRTLLPMILQDRVDAIIAALMEYGTTFVHCEEELGLGDWYMNFLTIMDHGCVTLSGPPDHIVPPFSHCVDITMATAKYMLPVLHRIDNAVGGLVFIVQHSRSFAAATLVFLRNDRLHEHFLDVLQCLQVEFLAGRLESFIVSDTFGSSFAAVELWAKNRQEYKTLRKHLSERLLHMYPRRSSLSSIMQTEEEEQSSGSSYLEATFFRQQASAMVSLRGCWRVFCNTFRFTAQRLMNHYRIVVRDSILLACVGIGVIFLHRDTSTPAMVEQFLRFDTTGGTLGLRGKSLEVFFEQGLHCPNLSLFTVFHEVDTDFTTTRELETFLNWNNLSPVNSNMASIGNDLVFHNSAAEPVIYPIARHIFSTCRMGLQQLSKVSFVFQKTTGSTAEYFYNLGSLTGTLLTGFTLITILRVASDGTYIVAGWERKCVFLEIVQRFTYCVCEGLVHSVRVWLLMSVMLWLFRPADAFRLTDVIHAIGFSISATGIVYLGLDLFQAPDLVVGLLILCSVSLVVSVFTLPVVAFWAAMVVCPWALLILQLSSGSAFSDVSALMAYFIHSFLLMVVAICLSMSTHQSKQRAKPSKNGGFELRNFTFRHHSALNVTLPSRGFCCVLYDFSDGPFHLCQALAGHIHSSGVVFLNDHVHHICANLLSGIKLLDADLAGSLHVQDVLIHHTRMAGFTGRWATQFVCNMLQLMDVESIGPRPLHSLVPSEKARVALILLIIGGPPVVMYLERGDVDHKTRKKILTVLKDYSEAATVIYCTTDPFVADMASDILWAYKDGDHVLRKRTELNSQTSGSLHVIVRTSRHLSPKEWKRFLRNANQGTSGCEIYLIYTCIYVILLPMSTDLRDVYNAIHNHDQMQFSRISSDGAVLFQASKLRPSKCLKIYPNDATIS